MRFVFLRTAIEIFASRSSFVDLTPGFQKLLQKGSQKSQGQPLGNLHRKPNTKMATKKQRWPGRKNSTGPEKPRRDGAGNILFPSANENEEQFRPSHQLPQPAAARGHSLFPSAIPVISPGKWKGIGCHKGVCAAGWRRGAWSSLERRNTPTSPKHLL